MKQVLILSANPRRGGTSAMEQAHLLGNNVERGKDDDDSRSQ